MIRIKIIRLTTSIFNFPRSRSFQHNRCRPDCGRVRESDRANLVRIAIDDSAWRIGGFEKHLVACILDRVNQFPGSSDHPSIFEHEPVHCIGLDATRDREMSVEPLELPLHALPNIDWRLNVHSNPVPSAKESTKRPVTEIDSQPNIFRELIGILRRRGPAGRIHLARGLNMGLDCTSGLLSTNRLAEVTHKLTLPVCQ